MVPIAGLQVRRILKLAEKPLMLLFSLVQIFQTIPCEEVHKTSKIMKINTFW